MLFSKKIHYIPYKKYMNFQQKLRYYRKEMILFVEHPPTITSGINSKDSNLLVRPLELKNKNIKSYTIERGGDFTAHEPGQLVVYIHIDLKKRNLKISDFLHKISLVFIQTTKNLYGLELIWDKKFPGLYLKDSQKKLISFGICFKSFFTSYGFAFNIHNSLETFQYINPCGLEKNRMTSLLLLNISVEKNNLIDNLKKNFIKFLNL